MKALLELVISVISIDEVPEFLMEIVCEEPVPIFTSPKSTEDGVVTTAFAPVDENARESDPQPARPTLNRMEQTRAAIPEAL